MTDDNTDPDAESGRDRARDTDRDPNTGSGSGSGTGRGRGRGGGSKSTHSRGYDKRPTVRGEKFPSQRDRQKLLDLPNVVGHGIGPKVVDGKETANLAIRVFVTEKVPKSELGGGERIPKRFEGFETDVIERSQPRLEAADMDADAEADAATDADTDADAALDRGSTYSGRNVRRRPAAGGTIYTNGDSYGTGTGTYWDTAANQPIVANSQHVIGFNGIRSTEDEVVGTDVYQPFKDPDREPPRWHIGPVVKASNHAVEAERSDICYADPDQSNMSDPLEVSTFAFPLGRIVGVQAPELDVRYVRSGMNTGLLGGRCLTVDQTVNFGTQNDPYLVHDLFEYEGKTHSGDSGSIIGHVGPNGDVVAVGSHLAGYDDPDIRKGIGTPITSYQWDSGLDPIDPLWPDHTDHPLVVDRPAFADRSGYWDAGPSDGFLEAGSRRITRDSETGDYNVSVIVGNSGEQPGNGTVILEHNSDGVVGEATFDLDPAEYTLQTFTVDGGYRDEWMHIYTEDQLADAEWDADGFGFSLTPDNSPSGWTRSDWSNYRAYDFYADDQDGGDDGTGSDPPQDSTGVRLHGDVSDMGGYSRLYMQFLVRQAQSQSQSQ